MAYEYGHDPSAPEPDHCRTAKELLDHVSAELARYEAKKLAELKAELDAFVKKQDGLVADYKTRFPALRKLWCDRQVDVERLCAHIKCEFPLKEEKWKKLIENCICTQYHDLCCLEQRIAARKRCCTGPLERARDAAKVAFDNSKRRLDNLNALATRLDASLADNLKIVGQIEKLAPNERTVALYLFWFKLVPAHHHMAPFDASAECKKVCSDWDPNTLCSAVYAEPCPDEDGACTPKDGKPHDRCSHFPPAYGPWLMSPEKYCHALDCSWHDYHTAKEALSEAEAALKNAPDDLDSLIKKQADDAKGLDDAIVKCLKNVKLPDDCCKDGDSAKKGAY